VNDYLLKKAQERAYKAVEEIEDDKLAPKPRKFSEIVAQIDEAKKSIEILPTGLPEIDAYLEGGLLKKELVIIGGGTGKGKSLVAGNIFYNIASKGYKSAYFTLEISNEMLVSRLIGANANISPTRIMIKMLDEVDTKKKNETKADLSVYEEFMYFYDDLYQYELIEKEILENGYDFVVIDFIQNIMLAKNEEYERLSQIALNLQKLAKKANCCILGLSQLSNMVSRERKTDVVEYKGSGSIGTVADLGFFIEEGVTENSMILRLRKNRRGVSGAAFNFAVKQPGGLLVSV
jgi:replicative DNA helicase